MPGVKLAEYRRVFSVKIRRIANNAKDEKIGPLCECCWESEISIFTLRSTDQLKIIE